MEDLPTTQTELAKQAVRMTVFHNLQKLVMTNSKNYLENMPKPYMIKFLITFLHWIIIQYSCTKSA